MINVLLAVYVLGILVSIGLQNATSRQVEKLNIIVPNLPVWRRIYIHCSWPVMFVSVPCSATTTLLHFLWIQDIETLERESVIAEAKADGRLEEFMRKHSETHMWAGQAVGLAVWTIVLTTLV